MSYKSRIPAIAAALEQRLDAVAEKAAEEVASKAKENLALGPPPVHLKQGEHIHTQREGVGEWYVIAGDSDTFYGHIVEHGSVHAGAHPFLVPAAEEVKDNIDSISREALAGL